MDDLPIGRYGTIHYMSNNGSEIPIASYPIDEAVINLGRSDHNTCHIRLLDLWCSDVHCKVVFEEGKAFLIVLGDNGVIVDGSSFLPTGDEEAPTTIPLTNGSEWLISKRRFIFQYPPKDQRAKLLATPFPKSRKSLRMSMVKSAQLWTPTAQTGDLADRLRSLRSPVKPFTEDRNYQVTLVEGDPLHFAQSTEEVVVVERVEAQLNPEPVPLSSPLPKKLSQTPKKPQQANLHKRVLLMNSHRKQAHELDESDEEKEVEASIFPEDDSDEELEEDAISNPFITKDRLKVGDIRDTSSSDKPLTAKSFRESLGAIGSVRPFGRPSGNVAHTPNSHEKAPDSIVVSYQEDEPEGTSSTTPLKQNLGAFMTPQINRTDYKGQPRQSVGGSALRYTQLDEDLEAARRRLANLGSVSRPQVVTLGPEDAANVKPAVKSIKKPRSSLAEIPDFSSPLPPYRSAMKKPAMTPIVEPDSSPIKKIDEGMEEDDDDDSAVRLQRLMRTVERAARRESIRESRKSVAAPDDFWSAPSPTKGAASGLQQSSVDISAQSFSLAGQSNLSAQGSESMSIDFDDDDISHANSLSNAPNPANSSTSTGRTNSAKRKVADAIYEDMEIDRSRSLSSSTSSHPGEIEQTSSGSRKRRTRQVAKQAQDLPVGNVVGRARSKDTMSEEIQEPSQDESGDANSIDIDQSNQPIEREAPTRARRGRSTKTATASTSIRKPTRSKATSTTATAKEEEEESHLTSNNQANVADQEAITSQRPRTKKTVAKKTAEISLKQETEESQSEPSVVAPATTKRATRSRAAPAVEESVEQAKEQPMATAAKRTASKKVTGTKKGKPPVAEPVIEGDDEEMGAQVVVEKSKAKAATRDSKKAKEIPAVKDEPEEEVVTETKPRRTARTKR